jgi:ABC-type glycerol-3-phosphate transport system substrate-binding protein
MKKKIAASLLSSFLVLTACGTQETKVEETSTSGSSEVTDNKEETKMVTFNGLADPHTMEVEVDGEIRSIQFNPDILDQIEEMEEGKEYQVKVKENEKGQIELVEIMK